MRLSHGDREAIVVEVGGGIRSFRAGGRLVIDGYAEDEVCKAGRGQVLAPWPNRLRDGRYVWEGSQLQAPLNEPERSNAIHGLVRWATWSVTEESPSSARLAYRLPPQPGWAWTLELAVSYSLGECGLEVVTMVTNLGPGDCPFGLGWHPYLAAPGGGLIDSATLCLPAETALRSDDRGLPAGCYDVRGTDVDFRSGRPIGASRLDTGFTDLARDADGRCVVELGAGRNVTSLWMDSAYSWVMVYTGDTIDDPNRRRRGLAVEPMTCPPDMLNSGEDRVVLAEGGSFEAAWGLNPSW